MADEAGVAEGRALWPPRTLSETLTLFLPLSTPPPPFTPQQAAIAAPEQSSVPAGRKASVSPGEMAPPVTVTGVRTP